MGPQTSRETTYGVLLYEYTPVPVDPLLLAVLIVGGVLTFLTAPLISAQRGLFPLGGLCFLPLASLVLVALLLRPSPLRLYGNGLDVPLPRVFALAGRGRHLRYEDIENVYPSSFELATANLSPFAAASGLTSHPGICVETRDGNLYRLSFTPARMLRRTEVPAGYSETLAVLQAQFRRSGRPMVSQVLPYSEAELNRMQETVLRPLLPFAMVSFLTFLLPPTIVGAFLLFARGNPGSEAYLPGVFLLAFLPIVVVVAFTFLGSRNRARLLGEISKFRTHQQEKNPEGDPPRRVVGT